MAKRCFLEISEEKIEPINLSNAFEEAKDSIIGLHHHEYLIVFFRKVSEEIQTKRKATKGILKLHVCILAF